MSTNLLASLSAKQLHQAASIRERIDALEQQLASILNVGSAPARAAATPKAEPAAAGKKRVMSAAAKERIAEAQRKRWAKIKAAAKK
jgi:hypothetical protein